MLIDQIETDEDIWLAYENGSKSLGERLFNIESEIRKGERVFNITHTSLY
jgi:hypothetical protein